MKNAYGNCDDISSSGKIINEFHYNRLCNLLKEDHGGEIIIGNKDISLSPMILKPTIILNPRKNSNIM